MEKILTEIWAKILKNEKIELDDNFFGIGGQSLTALEMLHEVEQRTGIVLPLTILIEHNTIHTLSKAINNKIKKNLQSPLQILNRGGKKEPLFLVHAQSGTILMYKDLAEEFQDRNIYGLQSPFLYPNPQGISNLEELATIYIKEIRKVQLAGPYHLSGMCLGGKIALEIARQLKDIGETVGVLAILDSNIGSVDSGNEDRGSQISEQFEVKKRTGLLKRIDRYLEESRSVKVTVRRLLTAMVHRLTTRLWIGKNTSTRHNILKKYYGIQLYAIKRAEFFHRCLHSNYKVRPYAGAITLYRSAKFDSKKSKQKHVERWNAVAQSGLSVTVLPGEHLTLLHHPYVSALAREMQSKMNNYDLPGSALVSNKANRTSVS